MTVMIDCRLIIARDTLPRLITAPETIFRVGMSRIRCL